MPAGTIPNVLTSGDVPMYVGGPYKPIWNGEGCWLAQTVALYELDPGLESYLSLGEYRIVVTIGCDKGQGDSGTYMITSPTSWEGLHIKPV